VAAVSDKPIIFSGPMVRALLDRRKTQTRRLLKPQLGDIAAAFEFVPGKWRFVGHDGARVYQVFRPPYASGDRLYVKEAWRTMDRQDSYSGAQIGAQCIDAGYRKPWSPLQYEADGARDNWIADPHTFGTKPGRYRHARFMPRWASRLTLIVTDVRVQRLQEISTDDALAEGVDRNWRQGASSLELMAQGLAKNAFRDLWNSLHGPDAWAANPWCVALTFTVHRCNIDQMPGEAP